MTSCELARDAGPLDMRPRYLVSRVYIWGMTKRFPFLDRILCKTREVQDHILSSSILGIVKWHNTNIIECIQTSQNSKSYTQILPFTLTLSPCEHQYVQLYFRIRWAVFV